MKHMKRITVAPSRAQGDPTPGIVLSIIAEILLVLGGALTAKETTSN